AGIPKGLSPDDIDLTKALGLLSLPRTIGTHPEDGVPILAGVGRFGPYVQHGKTYANLEAGDDVLTIGLNRAVTLIAGKKAKGPSRGRFGAGPGRPLGEHPDKGGPVVVKNGRYGPYVSHDGINATLPSDMTPETVTLEQALPLLDARAARGTGRKVKRGAAKAASKDTAKDATKEAAKKAAPKTEAKGPSVAANGASKKASAKKAAPKAAAKPAPKTAKAADPTAKPATADGKAPRKGKSAAKTAET